MYEKNNFVFLSVAVVSLLLSGYATMFSGKTQKINLTSTKPYKVDIGGITYDSPSIIALDKSDEDKIVTIKECGKQIILKSIIPQEKQTIFKKSNSSNSKFR